MTSDKLLAFTRNIVEMQNCNKLLMKLFEKISTHKMGNKPNLTKHSMNESFEIKVFGI